MCSANFICLRKLLVNGDFIRIKSLLTQNPHLTLLHKGTQRIRKDSQSYSSIISKFSFFFANLCLPFERLRSIDFYCGITVKEKNASEMDTPMKARENNQLYFSVKNFF